MQFTLLYRVTILCLVSLALGACSDNSSDRPSAPQPKGHITIGGVGALGPIRDARITAYHIKDACAPAAMAQLGEAVSDRFGRFNITIAAERGQVLFVLAGGSYVEEASGRTVNLKPDQHLYAISSIGALSTKELVITPWSHIQSGLFCWMLENGHGDLAGAEQEAKGFMQELLAFDPRYVGYQDPTDPANRQPGNDLAGGLKLGFINAALSQWSMHLSQQMEYALHDRINSAYLAQLFYRDIHNDGRLDGRTAGGPIYLVGRDDFYALNSASYRLELPRRMLRFYDHNARNAIAAQGRGELYAMARRINDNRHALVFAAMPPAPVLDGDAPAVTWLSTRVLSGVANITLHITDLTGLKLRGLAFYGQGSRGLIDSTSQKDHYQVQIDTRDQGSGRFDYRVAASDIIGNSATYSFPVELINAPPRLSIQGANMTRTARYDLRAQFTRISPGQSLASANCGLEGGAMRSMHIQPSSVTASCTVRLAREGVHFVRVNLCDTNDLCATHRHRVIYDKQAPGIEVLNLHTSHLGNLSLTFRVTDGGVGLTESVLWQANGNQQTMHGLARKLKDKNNTYQVFFDGTRFGDQKVELVVEARDLLGNVAKLRSRHTIVNTPATATISSPARFKDNFYIATFKVRPNSYTNPRVSCRVLGHTGFRPGEYDAVDNFGHCELLLPGVADGNKTLAIRICGDYNLCALTHRTIVRDTTPPSINADGLKASYSGGAIPIEIIMRDEHSAVTKASYSLDGGHFVPLTRQGDGRWAWTLAADQLTTGRHFVQLRASDSVGNLRTVRKEFLILRDEPRISRTSPATTQNQAYSLTASIAPGTYPGKYAASCRLGQYEVPARVRFNALSCALDLSGLADGKHVVQVQLATDYGVGYTRSLSFIKDTTAPTIDASTMAKQYRSGIVPISVAMRDRHAGIQAASYKLDDGPFIALTSRGSGRWEWNLAVDQLATGRHHVLLRAVDAVGNWRELQKEFLILRDEPGINRTSPQRTRSDAYTLTATIQAGTYRGTYTARCRIGSREVPASVRGRSLSCSLDLSDLPDGEHTVRVQLSTDYGIDYTRSLKFTKDKTAPTIDATALKRQYHKGVTPIDLTIRDRHSTIVAASYKLDGEAFSPLTFMGTDRWRWNLAVDQLNTGRHLVHLRALDAAGNQREIQKEFLVLRDGPIIRRTSANRTKSNAYTLTATINPGSYTGTYTVICRLNNRQSVAEVRNGGLSCVLDLTGQPDGEQAVQVRLTTDYAIDYTRGLSFMRDTAPPQIRPVNHRRAYTASAFTLNYEVVDQWSAVTHVQYEYDGRTRAARYLNGNLWQLSIDPTDLTSGEHLVQILARDALGQEREVTGRFTLVKEAPTLVFTHPKLFRTRSGDITGNLSLATPIAPVAAITCQVAGAPNIKARIQNKAFTCADYPVVNTDNSPISVEVCDIFNNCATFTTSVSQDHRSPLIPRTYIQARSRTYKWSTCPTAGSEYDTIPLSCPHVEVNTVGSGLYEIADPAQRNQIRDPVLIILHQADTVLNASQGVDRAQLARRRHAYIGMDTHDYNDDTSYHFTSAADLKITYSYTQVDCVQDIASNPRICPAANRSTYFRHKSLPFVAHDNQTGIAKITLVFADAFLQAASKPHWYLAAPRIIHRLDIHVCDEAGNCIQRVTRFRVKVIATAPVIANRPLPSTTRFQLQSKNHYLGNSRNAVATKKIAITNPIQRPIWYAFYTQQATEVEIQYSSARRLYGFRKRNWTQAGYTYRCYYDSGSHHSTRTIYQTGVWGSVISIREQLSSGPPHPAGIPVPYRPHLFSTGGCYWRRDTQASTRTRSGSAYETSQAPGYPKGTLAQTNVAQRRVKMGFHSIRADDGHIYTMDAFRKLRPGATHIIEYREVVPTTAQYSHSATIPVPASHSARPQYDTAARALLNNNIKIKYTKDLNGVPDRTSIQISSYTRGATSTFTAPLR